MSALYQQFVAHTEAEDPALAARLAQLGEELSALVARVAARFDRGRSGQLDADQRALVRRLLAFLHRPSARGLELLLQVLDYLDVNDDDIVDHQELTLAVEILELFARADSVNRTLSVLELEMLTAVLAHLDLDGNGVLDAHERTALRDGLWDPDAFLASQKRDNPRLRELLNR